MFSLIHCRFACTDVTRKHNRKYVPEVKTINLSVSIEDEISIDGRDQSLNCLCIHGSHQSSLL